MSVELLTMPNRMFMPGYSSASTSDTSNNANGSGGSGTSEDVLGALLASLAAEFAQSAGQNSGNTEPNAQSGEQNGQSTSGGEPTATSSPDLLAAGGSLQQADQSQAMENFNKQDPARFQAFMSALSHGDGNAAAHTLADAVSSGNLSQADGAAIGAHLQQTANAHGGGKINDDARNALKQALGADVLTPGHTRADQYALDHLV